jgi:hypothetical protein
MSDRPIHPEAVWPCPREEYRPGAIYAWTQAELDVLRAHYVADGIYACLSRLPARSKGTAMNYASKLGLYRQKRHAPAQKHNDMLDAAIKRLYSSSTTKNDAAVRDLAKRWNVTRQYISRRALLLGVRPPLRPTERAAWTPEEDELLEQHVAKSPEALQRIFARHGFKRTPSACASRRLMLELSPTDDPDVMTARALAQAMGCSEQTVTRWIRTGQLKAKSYHDDVHKSRWCIQRRHIREFLIRNAEWDHRRCNRDWLIETLSGQSGPRINMREAAV